ncbi:MAG: hypothetical protein R6X02_05850 [Enhygromyxa sp.]
MPTETHQNFVLLFLRHPELLFELARRAGASVDVVHDRIELTAAEFDDPLKAGNAVRADLAAVRRRGKKALRALALEVQLGRDRKKEWSSVLYRAALRYRLNCPAWTVFFSPDPEVREFLSTRMFEHEPELRPKVVTPAMIEPILDLDAAIADYPWAVLSAVMHADSPDAVVLAMVAIQALLRVAPQDFWRYIQLVTASVSEDVMQRVRTQLPPNEQEELSAWERRGSTFTRGLAEGRERGREEGLEEGREEGREEGLEEGLARLRAALQAVLAARELPVDEQTSEWIATCSDLDALRDAIVRAATITATDELLH